MIKIKGIKKIAGESKQLSRGRGCCLQINYDMKTHEAWSDFLVGVNSWIVYYEENVIYCGQIRQPKTMKEIEEIIIDRIQTYEAYKAYEGR